MGDILEQINKIYLLEKDILNNNIKRINILSKMEVVKQSNLNFIISERRNNKLRYSTNEIRDNILFIRLNMDEDFKQKEEEENALQIKIKLLNIELHKEERIYEMLIKTRAKK